MVLQKRDSKGLGKLILAFSKNWFSFDFKVFFVPVYFSFRVRLKVVLAAFLFVFMLVTWG